MQAVGNERGKEEGKKGGREARTTVGQKGEEKEEKERGEGKVMQGG